MTRYDNLCGAVYPFAVHACCQCSEACPSCYEQHTQLCVHVFSCYLTSNITLSLASDTSDITCLTIQRVTILYTNHVYLNVLTAWC
jgi:hypothetical protein